ncbi:hypothetical protein OIO90_003999 [Microbotryomycetes sp. JL221]|nr:hypothetical protein OIO90_003999 [Microbotryomycetes sp. JL221]
MPNFIDVPSFKLNTGASIPAVGLGTWQSKPGEVENAVEVALKNGYKHLDCAWIYGNEDSVQEGIKRSGVKREDIFITTKLWCTKHRDPVAAIDESLKLLGVEYVDLYLIHWPVPMNGSGNDPKFPTNPDGSRDIDTDWSVAKTWEGMEKVLASGKAKAIGVSNFSQAFLEDLLKTAKTIPAANQIELHPYLPQHELVAYLHKNDIMPQAYSPLGSTDSPLVKDPVVQKIADKHAVATGTILISYQVARKVVVLPKSVTDKRVIDNLKIVALDDEDMQALNDLHKQTTKRFVKPNWGVDLKFDNW